MMDLESHIAKAAQRRWDSLDVIQSPDSLVLRERKGQSRSRLVAEAVLSFVGAVMIIGAYLHMLLPQALPGITEMASPLLFSAGLVAIGLGLYAFGTRGHVPEFGLDRTTGDIWFCKRNSNGTARLTAHFAQATVKSMYVSRGLNASQDAALCLRLVGKDTPIQLLRGRQQEIESAHRILGDALQAIKVAAEMNKRAAEKKAALRVMPRRIASLRKQKRAAA